MKISQAPGFPVGGSTSTGPQAQPQVRGTSDPSSVAASNPTGVPVSVSSLGQSLQAGASDSVVDHEKVNAIRAQIASGQYKVNAGAIADKMLSNAHEVFQRSRSQA
jgi:negative regulator of flagellin synthesis FlgM